MDDGGRQGELSTVNGSIRIGSNARVGEATTVNGSVHVADMVQAGDLGTVNGSVRVGRNVTVNAVTPGFIETDMTGELDPKLKEEHLKAIPLGRYGQADEVAQLVRFLVSESAAYITGQVIGINGGMYM